MTFLRSDRLAEPRLDLHKWDRPFPALRLRNQLGRGRHYLLVVLRPVGIRTFAVSPIRMPFPGCPLGVCLVTARTVEGMNRILARLVDRADVLRGDVMPVDGRASQAYRD